MIRQVLGKNIFLDGSTGSIGRDPNELGGVVANSPNLDFFEVSFSEYRTTSITICINLSDACNLACDYCFNGSKSGKSIPLDECIRFLDACFSRFPDKEKYFVDLSGKGEPLLFLDKILKIKKHCVNKSNELRREVLVQFVCNGTLLSLPVAETLQRHGILFGVSIDGCREIHDKHRTKKDRGATFDEIIANVKAIPHHEYVGAACTLTSDVFSLRDSLIELSKTFNTVGYKPARACEFAFSSEGVKAWCESYDELVSYLTESAVAGDIAPIKVLLNGDDYFGKFVKRIFLGQRCLIRCDGSLSRFTLDGDGKVYPCPAAFGMGEFAIGEAEHLDESAMERMFVSQIRRPECAGCDFRYLCGGECAIEKKLSGGLNAAMCEYKRHVILLAAYFAFSVIEGNRCAAMGIRAFCEEVESRKKIDPKLLEFLNRHPEMSFTAGKEAFDKLEHRY